MEKGTDKTVDILKIIRGAKDQAGLKIVKINTTDPDPITLVFEGTPLPLDLDIFEIPVSCYPLRKGDRLLAFPLVGQENGQRWAIITKLNGGVVMATMTGATSCQVVGIGRPYTAQDLIIPPYFAVSDEYKVYEDSYTAKPTDPPYLVYTDIRPLGAGDKVGLAPTYVMEGEVMKIKYVIIERY